MLNIKNELFKDLDDNDVLPMNNDTFEITNIIEEYSIPIDLNLLNSDESKYIALTKFINSFYLQNKELPENLKNLLKYSHNYRIFLLDDIKTRMENIVSKDSIYIFKEIYIILNLLSVGNKYELLEKQNIFSIKNLHLMLTDYENSISEQFIKKDMLSFKLTFRFYLILLEVLNEVCMINSLHIRRRKNISDIIKIISSSIYNLKNKLELDEAYSSSLDFILGKLFLNFTNMLHVVVDNNAVDVVIHKYLSMSKRIVEGFALLKYDDIYYMSFLNKLTTVLLTLIYKLKTKLHAKDILIEKSNDLLGIYNLYNNNVKKEHKIQAQNIDIFRDELVKNYKTIYESFINVSISDDIDLISHILSEDEISDVGMIIIHNLVLYSKNMSKIKLDLILKSLFEKSKFSNDYYELYKLKIIDRVLQRYISLKIDTEENTILEDIIKYIETNNLISHLMSMYAKIYLSLALYYSYEGKESSQKKSKRLYFIYQRLDYKNYLGEEFSSINRQILFNYANNYLKSFKFKTIPSFVHTELVEVGKSLIDEFIKTRKLEFKNKFLISVEKLNKAILQISEPNDSWLNSEIETLITEELFLGSVKAKIENSETISDDLEIGFEKFSLKITENYELALYYSSFHKDAFEKLFLEEQKFIELTVKNLFKSYINCIPSYTDVITKLPNINKLKTRLRKNSTETITFIEVYLNCVVKFSEKYNIKTSNEFFREVANKIKERYKTYRLFGPKVGIILRKDEDYRELISFLKDIEIVYDGDKYELEPVIAISIGEANKILNKSFYALSAAKMSENKVYYYK